MIRVPYPRIKSRYRCIESFSITPLESSVRTSERDTSIPVRSLPLLHITATPECSFSAISASHTHLWYVPRNKRIRSTFLSTFVSSIFRTVYLPNITTDIHSSLQQSSRFRKKPYRDPEPSCSHNSSRCSLWNAAWWLWFQRDYRGHCREQLQYPLSSALWVWVYFHRLPSHDSTVYWCGSPSQCFAVISDRWLSDWHPLPTVDRLTHTYNRGEEGNHVDREVLETVTVQNVQLRTVQMLWQARHNDGNE